MEIQKVSMHTMLELLKKNSGLLASLYAIMLVPALLLRIAALSWGAFFPITSEAPVELKTAFIATFFLLWVIRVCLLVGFIVVALRLYDGHNASVRTMIFEGPKLLFRAIKFIVCWLTLLLGSLAIPIALHHFFNQAYGKNFPILSICLLVIALAAGVIGMVYLLFAPALGFLDHLENRNHSVWESIKTSERLTGGRIVTYFLILNDSLQDAIKEKNFGFTYFILFLFAVPFFLGKLHLGIAGHFIEVIVFSLEIALIMWMWVGAYRALQRAESK